MQTLGFVHTLSTGAKDKAQRSMIKKNRIVFNTHPYMASYVIGAALRAYDDRVSSAEDIKRFVTIAQTSFASAGDLLFWRTIRPALLILSSIIALHMGIVGPLVFLIIYNIFHLYHRIKGISDGYARGADVIYLLKSKRFTAVSNVFEILGAFLAGMLVSLAHCELHYLLIIPLAILFIVMIFKRFSHVLIIITLILLILITVMV
jgi:PTS system N-acetylgalactosamine-specific IID component